ncbi:unnamed protein product [Amaranthus hypochondriacus]
MASPKLLILPLVFTILYLFPYIIIAQDHPFTALIVPLQNPPTNINNSPMEVSRMTAAILPLQNTEVSSNRWLFFCFGLVLGVSIIALIGAILYFIFGGAKLNPFVPNQIYYEAQEKGFNGEYVLSEKKI